MNRALIERFNFVKSMNTIVTSLNNEEAYDLWIYVVPDEADDYDFYAVAKDEDLFEDAVNCFTKIMKHYLENGFYL